MSFRVLTSLVTAGGTDATAVSGVLDTRLYQTGHDIIGLINSSAAGVASINNASGLINITGRGGITVISGAVGLIYISGVAENFLVHKTTNESITGIKTFVDGIVAPSISSTIFSSFIDVNSNILYESHGLISVDWAGHRLINIGQLPTLNWQDAYLSGVWSGQAFLISGNNVLTGFNSGQYLTGFNSGQYLTGFNSGQYLTGFNSGRYLTGFNSGQYLTGFNSGQYMTGFNSGQYITGFNSGQYATVVNLQSTGSILDNKINALTGFTSGTYIRVRDFGAVGNGVTDDTNALQAAFDYAISRGTGVIEFDSRTYNIATTGTPVSGGILNVQALTLQGNNPNLKLYFRGNGARLYSNITGSNGYAEQYDIFRVRSRFDTIIFDSLTFERGPALIGGSNDASGYAGLVVTNYDGTPVKKMLLQNCDFINCHRSFNIMSDTPVFTYATPLVNLFGKFQELRFNDCRFLYPSGCNNITADSSSQGGLVDNWVLNTYFDGCTFDGLIGSALPSGSRIAQAVDGFLFNNGINTVFTNSYFTNFDVEGLLMWPSYLIGSTTGYVQPATGSNVNVTLESTAFQTQIWITGERVRAGAGGQGQDYMGIYEVVTFSYPSVTLKRLPDVPSNVNKYANNVQGNGAIPAPVGSGIFSYGNGLYFSPTKYDNQFSVIVDNCIFDTIIPITSGSNLIGRGTPGINVRLMKTSITNNVFQGLSQAIAIQNGYAPDFGLPSQPMIISNNLFCEPELSGYGTVYAGQTTQYAHHYITFSHTDNIHIINNTFINDSSYSVYSAINVHAHNYIIKDNTFIIKHPYTGGYSGISGPENSVAIRLDNNYNVSPFQPSGWFGGVIQDNYNYGYSYSVGAQLGQQSLSPTRNFLGEPLISHAYNCDIDQYFSITGISTTGSKALTGLVNFVGTNGIKTTQSGNNINVSITGLIAYGPPPVTSTSNGYFGQVIISGQFLYCCTGTNQWARVTIPNTLF